MKDLVPSDEEEEARSSFSPPCESRAKRWLSSSQENGPHQELNLPAP